MNLGVGFCDEPFPKLWLFGIVSFVRWPIKFTLHQVKIVDYAGNRKTEVTVINRIVRFLYFQV